LNGEGIYYETPKVIFKLKLEDTKVEFRVRKRGEVWNSKS
jgi:hypothetical protein